MTRPRPAHPGRAVLALPRSPLLLLLVVCSAIVGGCIGGDVDDGGTATPAAVTSSEPSTSTAPSAPSLRPSPSSSPSEDASPSASASGPPSAAPSSLPPEVAVEACAGTDENKAFYADAAANIDWPVYCPVLPARWFVSSGSYSGRGVGQLSISYKGPSGATLSLQEGAFCETSDGCVPPGTDSGEASFGDQPGTLVTLDDGGYAIVVGRAETPSWLAVATGIDEATFRDLAAGFVRLD